MILHRSISSIQPLSQASRLWPAIAQRSLQPAKRYACQIHHPTKLGQLRAKLRTFGQGHIELDLSHAPGLALLTLSNPGKHNSLTGKMMAELADCIDFLEEAVTKPTMPALSSESGLILKSGGVPLKSLEPEHRDILEGLVGVIVTGAEQKSYCAGLGI